MKKIIFLGCAIGLAGWIVSCKQQTAPTADAPISQDSLIKRGDYLVMTMGCDDCHSPKVMSPKGPMVDQEHRLSGSPSGMQLPPTASTAGFDGWVLMSMDQTVAKGPWGTSYAANITSDSTGIGAWSEAQFFTALRKGKWKGLEGTRDLMPPMPWPNYGQLSDTDLKAMFAYLKSTKPVKNVVPAWQPPAAPPPPPAQPRP